MIGRLAEVTGGVLALPIYLSVGMKVGGGLDGSSGRGSPSSIAGTEGNTFLYHTDFQIDIEPVPKVKCQGRPRKRYRIWIVGYEWEGSKLAPRLNDDDKLVQMLVKAKAPEIAVNGHRISFHDKKLPKVKLFQCVDRIAGHVRQLGTS